jgi:hypothetical protein
VAERNRQKPAKLPTVVKVHPGPQEIMAKNKNKKSTLQQEEEYVAFLKKRIESSNYKSNVSKEEYEKTKEKYEKAKLKLRFLK